MLVDLVRAAAAERRALVPVHARFGVRCVGADTGRVDMGQSMGPHLLDGADALSPGAFLIAADAALGAAIATALPTDRAPVSLTLDAQFLRLQVDGCSDFLVTGEVSHLDEGSASARGSIRDDLGRTLALLSTHCAVLPTRVRRSPGPGASTTSSSTHCVPLDDMTLPASADHLPGLTPLAAHRAGVRRLPPGTDGDTRLALSAESGMCNSRGEVQGGVLGFVLEQAVTTCLRDQSPAGTNAGTMGLHVAYLRAVRPGQRPLEVVARPEHSGRRFATAHAVMRDGDGRAVASAMGSRYRG